MAREFDLLGDPIPDNRGKVGATGHIPTVENINKVRLLIVAKWTAAQIAEEIGISVPTLNKHYFRNKSIKHAKAVSISEAKGRILLQLNKAAIGGNVTALKELLKLVEREELAMVSDTLTDRKPKKKKLGVKQQGLEDARDIAGSSAFLPDYGKTGKPN